MSHTPLASMSHKITSNNTTVEPIMKIKINTYIDNVIKVPMPDQSKAIILRPLWVDDKNAADMAYQPIQAAYINKLNHIIDDLNDRVENLFLNSEEYKSASINFKKKVREALRQTRNDFLDDLAN